MAKQIEMQLNIRADASQAKKEMQNLQESLKKLTYTNNFSHGFGADFSNGIKEAQQQVVQLRTALEAATNVDTGKLNFNKFNQTLKQSGVTLDQYAATLVSLGPQGTQAFLQLTKAITTADTKVVRLSELFKGLSASMMNVVKWQISSSVLTGFLSTLQQSYSYAQSLNESLNNIRIVTGYSAEYMEEFADRANKAAQALSTTTTAYTNASLIYFQQGKEMSILTL